MKLILHKIIKSIYIVALFIILINKSIFYAKTIDINGIKAEINVKTIRENIVKGASTKDNNNSTIGNNTKEKDNKVPEDKYVIVELIIDNKNLYETANITIEEIAPTGFRQLESKKQDKVVNIKLKARTEKKIEYNYRYHQSFLKEQNNSILYDDDGNIIDNSKDITLNNNENSLSIENDTKKYKSNTKEEEYLQKGATQILILILTFIACVGLIYVFRMFYKTIKDNDDNFFKDNSDKFLQICLLLIASIIISILGHSDKVLADKTYKAQIYEYGKNYEKVIYDAVDFNGSLYRFAYKITVSYGNDYIISEEDYEKDTDKDLLVDALEYQYMTDKNDVDTDKDGLSDYIEVMFLDYNPLSDDTFNDGIKDSDRDYDNDKLTNNEEMNYGTDLFNADTDYDTINDYDEINVYNTDPLNVDTDEDLLIDPDELKLGLDPTNPRTDGITLDSERKIEQVYTMSNVPEELRKGDIYFKSINAEVAGLIDNSIKIKKYLDANLDNSKVVVGNIFKVENKNDCILNIVLDASKVSKRAKYLMVCKCEDSELLPIETIVNDNNELRCEIENGVYCIVDTDLVLRELSIFNDKYVVK